jgi:hypothetical protein
MRLERFFMALFGKHTAADDPTQGATPLGLAPKSATSGPLFKPQIDPYPKAAEPVEPAPQAPVADSTPVPPTFSQPAPGRQYDQSPSNPKTYPKTTRAALRRNQHLGNQDPWQVTQQNLLDLQEQITQTKAQLRQELLDQRSCLRHDWRQQTADLTPATPEHQATVDKLQQQIDTLNEALIKWFGTQKIANHVYFNKKRHYFLLDTTLRDLSGAQRALFKSLRGFFQGMQIPLSQLSTDFDANLASRVQQLAQDKLLTPKAAVLNQYRDLQELDDTVKFKPDIPLSGEMTKEHDAEHNLDKVYDGDQQLVMVIAYLGDQQIQTIAHYRADRMISRDIFDANGAVSSTQYFEQSSNERLLRENFYRQDGSLVLIKSYQENEPYIQLLSRSNVLMAVFNSELELTLWWLRHDVFNSETSILIPTDSPLYQPLLDIEDLKVEIIPILADYQAHDDITSQLMTLDSPIDSVLVTQQDAKTYLETQTQRELDVSVLPEVPVVDEAANQTGGVPKF